MNQNRNNNRRRGRGNNRGGGGNNNQSNRIDSRARGNAPQLLEKYKKLAHDASLNDDRVQTEYYLQFADHYFRVVADMKAQKDEARAKRDGDRSNQSDDDEADDDLEDEAPRAKSRKQSDSRNNSRQSDNRRGRRDRDDDDGENAGMELQRGAEGDDADGENPFSPDAKPKRTRRKKADPVDEDGGDEGISASILPPAIKKSDDEKPARKPRARRPRNDDDGAGEGPMEAVG